jgi:hypothetical protein
MLKKIKIGAKLSGAESESSIGNFVGGGCCQRLS